MRSVAGLIVGTGIVLAIISGAAIAADNPGLADFEPRDIDATSGDLVEVELTIRTASANDDEAVESIEYSLIYDPEILSIEAVEQGPWLQGGEGTDVSFETEVDEDVGKLTVEQARDPPAGGVIGEGTTATVTFEVADDAPSSNAIVQYEHYNAQMLEYPLIVLHDRTELNIEIDGGGDDRLPRESAERVEDESPGIITPESDSDDAEERETDAEAPEDQPGFGIVVAVLAITLAVAFRVDHTP